jgi:hypothetical protein
MGGDRLITCLVKMHWTKFTFSPQEDRPAVAPERGRFAYLIPAGYKDFPYSRNSVQHRLAG